MNTQANEIFAQMVVKASTLSVECRTFTICSYQTDRVSNMKREQFNITSTDGHDVTKTKWNSANRAVENLVGEIAEAEQTTYNLIDSESIKEGFNHVKGSRTWKSKEGKVVVFNIEKVA